MPKLPQALKDFINISLPNPLGFSNPLVDYLESLQSSTSSSSESPLLVVTDYYFPTLSMQGSVPGGDYSVPPEVDPLYPVGTRVVLMGSSNTGLVLAAKTASGWDYKDVTNEAIFYGIKYGSSYIYLSSPESDAPKYTVATYLELTELISSGLSATRTNALDANNLVSYINSNLSLEFLPIAYTNSVGGTTELGFSVNNRTIRATKVVLYTDGVVKGEFPFTYTGRPVYSIYVPDSLVTGATLLQISTLLI